MNMPMKAIIKKDLKNILSDKRMFSAILMVPLIMTVVLPAIFMVAVYFGSDDPDLQQMLALLPQHTAGYDIRPAASAMIFNIVFHHTCHDSLCNGRQFLCGRKRKAYSGDAPILPSVCEADLSGKDSRILFPEYAGFSDLFCSYGAGT